MQESDQDDRESIKSNKSNREARNKLSLSQQIKLTVKNTMQNPADADAM